MSRIEMFDVRGRAAVAAASTAEPGERRRLLRSALRDARALERERVAWASLFATLIRAGAATVAKHHDAALGLYARADALAGEAAMLGHAMAARRRYGELTNGTAGDRVVAAVDSWLRGRGVTRPDRFVALIAPGA